MSNDLVIAKLDRACRHLAEAKTLQQTKKIGDVARAMKVLAQRQGLSAQTIRYATTVEILALDQLGEQINAMRKSEGGRPSKTGLAVDPVKTLASHGVSKYVADRARKIHGLPPKDKEALIDGLLTEAHAIKAILRAKIMEQLTRVAAIEPQLPVGEFDVLVIDPAWPMTKIERDVRPNQVEFPYPVMTEPELLAWDIPKRFAATNCHVFLWTTQRFLPFSFDCLTHWGFNYVLTFVWHKPGGFQPVGLPQFNCEFCVYARKGTPIFLDTKQFDTCFEAPRGKHSEKPELFYETLRRVTGGRRLDIGNRRPIDGFVGFGKEA